MTEVPLIMAKICNINFWIGNDPPSFGTFLKVHPFLKGQASLNEVIKVLSHPVVPFHVNDQCRLLAECFRTEAALELLDVEVDLPMVLQSL